MDENEGIEWGLSVLAGRIALGIASHRMAQQVRLEAWQGRAGHGKTRT